MDFAAESSTICLSLKVFAFAFRLAHHTTPCYTCRHVWANTVRLNGTTISAHVMQIQLEDLDYQRHAIAAVVGVFDGQVKNTFDNSNLCV